MRKTHFSSQKPHTLELVSLEPGLNALTVLKPQGKLECISLQQTSRSISHTKRNITLLLTLRYVCLDQARPRQNYKFLASPDSRWLSSITMVLTTSPRQSCLPWAVEEKQLNFLTQVEIGEDEEIEIEEVINNFETRDSDCKTVSPQRQGHTKHCRAERMQQFRTTMRPLWQLLQVLGMVPFRFCQHNGQYELSWCSWAAWRTILTTVYVTTLLAVSVTGLVIVLSSGGSNNLDPDEEIVAIKLAGIILKIQCLINTWIQFLCVMGTVRRLCSLMNSWCLLAADCVLDITKGVKLVLLRQLSFLFLFWSVSITLTLLTYPGVYISILDALGQTMLLLPKDWTTLPTPLPLV